MTWQDKVNPIKVGEKVAYSARWLRSIGCYTGELPQMRGVVTEIKPLGQKLLATVTWNDSLAPMKVLTDNLSRVTEKGILDRD